MVGGRVLITPYEGARSFVTWALDLWPYVNGKCLTMGIVLEDLDSSDMLDVIHYLFEEDSLGPSGEFLEARSSARESIYSMIYGAKYKYSIKSSNTSSQYDRNSFMANGDDITPFDPESASFETKPYIPPSDFDPDSYLPFGGSLEPPQA